MYIYKFFSTLIPVFYILLVWRGVFSCTTRILLFFTHNRSNHLISVRIVPENCQFVKNFDEKEFHSRCLIKYVKNPEKLFSQTTHSRLLGFLYFQSFKLLRKLYFPSVWLISSSSFMFKCNNINIRKTREICSKLAVTYI